MKLISPWLRRSQPPAACQPEPAEGTLARLRDLQEQTLNLREWQMAAAEDRWSDSRAVMRWHAADHPGDHTRCQIAYPGQPMAGM